jgi:hypothetical protein
MDLGEIGVILVAEGEAEARGAVERFVRARDAAVRSMEEGAQREIRAAEAIERAIQREIREYENLVRTASGLERAYQDLVASFNPLNRAQLEYARSIEMLDSALEANVINEQQRARAMDLLQQKMASASEAERTAEIERVARATAEHTREIQNAQEAYDRLAASLDPLVAAQQKYDAGIDVLNQAEAKRILTLEQRIAAEKRLDAQLAKDIAAVNAKQGAAGGAEEEKQAAATRKLKAEIDSLTSTVEVAARAQQLYDRAVRVTTQGVEAGAISADRAAQIMAATNSRIEAMGHIVNQNGEVLSRDATSWQRWARGGVQNAGYQVADFAVQVQGGTSAIVAFGQQAPQFLGMFGAFGAAAGAVVAIMAAVASYFVLTSGEAASLKDSVDELETSVRKYGDSIGLIRNLDLDEEFGNLAEQVRGVTEATVELDRAMLLSNLQKSIKAIKQEFIEPGLGQQIRNAFVTSLSGGALIDANLTEGSRQQNFAKLGLNIGYDVFEGMMTGMANAANAGDVEAVANTMSEMIKQAIPSGQLVDMDGTISDGAVFLLQLDAMYKLIAQANAEMNGSAEAAKDAAEAAEDAAKAEEKRLRELEKIAEARARDLSKGLEMLTTLHNQTELQEAILRYGEDSIGVETVKAQQAREAYFARVNALDIEDSLRQILRDSYDEMVAATDESSRFADEAARAKAEFDGIVGLITTIQGQIASLGLSNIGKEARLAALRAGQSEAEAGLAGTIATERARLSPALGAGEASIRAGAQAELDAFIASKQKELSLDTEISAIVKERRDAEREDKKGGGGKDDPLIELIRRVELERELLGVSESERDVRMAVAKADQDYTEGAIQNAIAILEHERAIIEQRQEMERLSNFIGDQVGDALMSIVDGTKSVKDAFKDMARAVISELYRVIVVQRIVNAVSGGINNLFGSANGNAFSNGSVVPYADGGVVSRPTLFPMSNGRTGLMGEAGPEAILPLKRGPSGQLGVAASGTGGITVTNNISVTGSDSEAVRREITKMIPQISKVTTAAVMDARKRGGTMKATFG